MVASTNHAPCTLNHLVGGLVTQILLGIRSILVAFRDATALHWPESPFYSTLCYSAKCYPVFPSAHPFLNLSSKVVPVRFLSTQSSAHGLIQLTLVMCLPCAGVLLGPAGAVWMISAQL